MLEFKGDPFEFVLNNYGITLRALASKYHWVLYSKEDVFNELVLNVAVTLVAYNGKMTNMDSLIKLLATRYIHELVRVYYKEKSFCADYVFLDSTDEYGFHNNMVETVSMENEVLLKMDLEQLDEEVVYFIKNATEAKIKKIHDGELDVTGAFSFAQAQHYLKDWEKGSIYDKK
jgi:hypothetical protein